MEHNCKNKLLFQSSNFEILLHKTDLQIFAKVISSFITTIVKSYSDIKFPWVQSHPTTQKLLHTKKEL